MLPHSGEAINLTHPGKFADTAVRELLIIMLKKGANIKRIQAKIFGGSEMFPSVKCSKKKTIGELNTQAVIKELGHFGIPLLAKDVGGNSGRSIYFATLSGLVTMKKIKEAISKIY
jgi:chemotaxis protein CheD